MKYHKRTFKDETVALDDNTFEACRFINCKLEYSGGKPSPMINCELERSNFAFSDKAANTINFMRAMYLGGFKAVIDRTIDNIRKKS